MNPGKYLSADEASYSPATAAETTAPFLSKQRKDVDFVDGSHSLWPKDSIAVTTEAKGDDDMMSTAAGTVSP